MVAKKKTKSKKTVKKKTKSVSKNEIKSGKTMAAISYLWIAGLILLLTEKKNKFVIFHAKQATALFVIETIASLTLVLSPIAFIAGIVGIYGLVMALQGNKTKIPLVYDLGQWIAGLLNIK